MFFHSQLKLHWIFQNCTSPRIHLLFSEKFFFNYFNIKKNYAYWNVINFHSYLLIITLSAAICSSLRLTESSGWYFRRNLKYMQNFSSEYSIIWSHFGRPSIIVYWYISQPAKLNTLGQLILIFCEFEDFQWIWNNCIIALGWPKNYWMKRLLRIQILLFA